MNLTHETRVLTDWTPVLVQALATGDIARAATAAATILDAAETACLALDPVGHVSPAVTLDNGSYLPPWGNS